jgi:hypothetical protein
MKIDNTPSRANRIRLRGFTIARSQLSSKVVRRILQEVTAPQG